MNIKLPFFERLALFLHEFLFRFELCRRIYFTLNGVQNCTVTGHALLAKHLDVSYKEVLAIHHRPSYPRSKREYWWAVNDKTQRCLLLCIEWTPPDYYKDLNKSTNFCHWLFYANGHIHHSCILHREASKDKRTCIYFPLRVDQVPPATRIVFDEICLDPKRKIDRLTASELCDHVKRFMLSNAYFAKNIDLALFHPYLNLLHRTALAGDTSWATEPLM